MAFESNVHQDPETGKWVVNKPGTPNTSYFDSKPSSQPSKTQPSKNNGSTPTESVYYSSSPGWRPKNNSDATVIYIDSSGKTTGNISVGSGADVISQNVENIKGIDIRDHNPAEAALTSAIKGTVGDARQDALNRYTQNTAPIFDKGTQSWRYFNENTGSYSKGSSQNIGSIKLDRDVKAGQLLKEIRERDIPLEYQASYVSQRSKQAQQTEKELVFGNERFLGLMGQQINTNNKSDAQIASSLSVIPGIDKHQIYKSGDTYRLGGISVNPKSGSKSIDTPSRSDMLSLDIYSNIFYPTESKSKAKAYTPEKGVYEQHDFGGIDRLKMSLSNLGKSISSRVSGIKQGYEEDYNYLNPGPQVRKGVRELEFYDKISKTKSNHRLFSAITDFSTPFIGGVSQKLKDQGFTSTSTQFGTGFGIGAAFEILSKGGAKLAAKWTLKEGVKKGFTTWIAKEGLKKGIQLGTKNVIGRAASKIPYVNTILAVGYGTYAVGKSALKSESVYQFGYELTPDLVGASGAVAGAGYVSAGSRWASGKLEIPISQSAKQTRMSTSHFRTNDMIIRDVMGEYRGNKVFETLVIEDKPYAIRGKDNTIVGSYKRATGKGSILSNINEKELFYDLSLTFGTKNKEPFAVGKIVTKDAKGKTKSVEYKDFNVPLEETIYKQGIKRKEVPIEAIEGGVKLRRDSLVQTFTDRSFKADMGESYLNIGESQQLLKYKSQIFTAKPRRKTSVQFDEQLAAGQYSESATLLDSTSIMPQLSFEKGRLRGKSVRYAGDIPDRHINILDESTIALERQFVLTKLQKPGYSVESRIFKRGKGVGVITETAKSKPADSELYFNLNTKNLSDIFFGARRKKAQLGKSRSESVFEEAYAKRERGKQIQKVKIKSDKLKFDTDEIYNIQFGFTKTASYSRQSFKPVILSVTGLKNKAQQDTDSFALAYSTPSFDYADPAKNKVLSVGQYKTKTKQYEDLIPALDLSLKPSLDLDIFQIPQQTTTTPSKPEPVTFGFDDFPHPPKPVDEPVPTLGGGFPLVFPNFGGGGYGRSRRVQREYSYTADVIAKVLGQTSRTKSAGVFGGTNMYSGQERRLIVSPQQRTVRKKSANKRQVKTNRKPASTNRWRLSFPNLSIAGVRI